MRPQKLTFNAFGAFPGSVTVDFDQLSPFGLFHIHGPTGAGKSTLLDALCYALYGVVPGLRGKSRTSTASKGADATQPDALLQSRHGEYVDKTVVSLEFSAQGVNYLIRREPPQFGPRGGFNSYPKVHVFKRSGEDLEPIASGTGEAKSFIKSVVGLDAGQFMQVVVLPQGLFAQALRADSNTRGALFRTLFDTARFGDYTERLESLSKEAKEELRGAAENVNSTRSRVDELIERLGLDIELDNDVVTGAPSLTGLQHLEVLSKEAQRVAATARDDSAKANIAAREALESVKGRDAAWARRRRASEVLAQCSTQSSQIDALRKEIGDAERCAPIAGFVSAFENASLRKSTQQQEVDRSHNSLSAHLASAPTQADGIDLNLASGDTLTAELCSLHIEFLQTRLHSLRDKLKLVDELESCVKLLAAAREEHAAADKVHGELTSRLQRSEALLEELATETDALSPVASTLELLNNQLETAQREHAAATQLRPARDKLTAAVDSAQSATAEFQAAEDARLALFSQRIDSMAGELAAKLSAGEPCAVCGSTEHPAPAESAAVVSEADLTKAEFKVVALRKTAEDRQGVRQRLEVDVAALVDRAAEAATTDDLGRSKVDQLQARIKEAVEARDKLRIARDRIDKGKGVLGDTQSELKEATQKQSEAASKVLARSERVKNIETRLGDADPTVLRGIESWTSRAIELFQQFAQSITLFAAADEQVQSANAALQRELNSVNIATVDEAKAMLRDPARITEMRAEASAWSERKHNAEQTIKEIDDLAIVEPKEDELVEAEARAVSMNDAYEASLRHFASVDHLTTDLSAATDALTKSIAKLEPLRKKRDQLTELYELCNGGGANLKKFSLEHWIMAGYLEEVVEAANVRLEKMTLNRYQLRHNASVASNNRASGLDIDVFDAYTGHTRAVTTLSGGETFMASLCLALGTADVVQRHAGGIHIEALFIDEGFGTLDSDTLELAIDELDRLREGGRLVGIISHVDSLRSRIPAGIEVVRTMSGSHITTSIRP